MLSNQDFYRLLFSIYIYLCIHLGKEYYSTMNRWYLLALAVIAKYYA